MVQATLPDTRTLINESTNFFTAFKPIGKPVEVKENNEKAVRYVTEKELEAMSIKEDSIPKDGYIEQFMGHPDFDKALKLLGKIWKEWKRGPATERGMEKYAADEIAYYINHAILK